MPGYSSEYQNGHRADVVQAGQYLSFTLGDEDYGIDILKVKEIRGWEAVRPLPDTPVYVKGVLDLRGSILPIIDMRMRFNLENAEYIATTVTIVLSIQLRGRPYQMGIVVDGVSDVLDIQERDISAAPSLGKKIDTRYIMGMVSLDERVVLLLDVDNLLDPDELESLGDVVGG
ncbi:MAG: chemotaxis protein CheW [Gammaproteobacteria bacterium]|jgi:purine-binding chemotaxis protein CheW|nr:chemotaxis protein CheW [Gammaproteobacteria bacterium]